MTPNEGVDARDAVAAMSGWWIEQVNFVMTVQSQQASRVANAPYPSIGRLFSSITGHVSRLSEGNFLGLRSNRDVRTSFPHVLINSIR